MRTAISENRSGEGRLAIDEPQSLPMTIAASVPEIPPLYRRTSKRVRTYHAFGLTISSCIDCPELIAAAGDPQVSVTYGDVPAELPGAKKNGVCYQAMPGQVLLHLDGIARFWVCDGKVIVIQSQENVEDGDVRVFLLSSALGALLQQRGLLVLHASMIKVGDGCVLFLGRSGAGKSTLAVAFDQRGYPCLSDNICVISREPNGMIHAIGASPCAQLWPDSLKHLALKEEGLRRVRPCLEKRLVPLGQAFCQARFPVRRVYEVTPSNVHKNVQLQAITGPLKMRIVRDSTYRLEFLHGQALTISHFRQLADFASLGLTQVFRPLGEFSLDRLVDAIEGDLRS